MVCGFFCHQRDSRRVKLYLITYSIEPISMIEIASAGTISSNKRSRENFLNGSGMRYARYTKLISPSSVFLRDLISHNTRDMDESAPISVIEDIFVRNPDTMLAIVRSDMRGEPHAAEAGLICPLPLTADGHDALFDGRLDTLHPDLKFIARQHEQPSAIYVWFIAMPSNPIFGGGIAHVVERMSTSRCRDVPLYCKAANARARTLFDRIGFVPGATHRGRTIPSLLYYLRSGETREEAAPGPVYDSYLAGHPNRSTGVTVARSLDQLAQCLAIRAGTFLPEQSIPYREDVDGNDLCSTHLLGLVEDEPAACMRVRCFSGFAKIERLAVLPRFRRSGITSQIVQASIEFCRAKGYTHVYGQAAPSHLSMWKRFGFAVRNSPAIQYLTDETYHEIDLSVEPSPTAINSYSGAAVLVRPEGRWHASGPLEA